MVWTPPKRPRGRPPKVRPPKQITEEEKLKSEASRVLDRVEVEFRPVDANYVYERVNLNEAQLEVRQRAVNDLEAFIRLVAPYQHLAHCHIDLCKWLTKNTSANKLLLWPRDHGKSRMAAFYAAWQIVRDPSTTIIYASATAEKAEEQLRFIKTILEAEVVFRYFPGLILPKEGMRMLWNTTNIIVDHPKRRAEGVVDSTIMTCGLGKTITGKHCRHLIFDDIVVPENNSEQGRKDVNSWVAQAASIMSTDSEILAVGTRYHPKDAYATMMDMEYDAIEDEEGDEVARKPLFTILQSNVEIDGQFLWPRDQRETDGKWFGFNQSIINKKRAVYEANGQITQFFAQYYNDPNDRSTVPISRDMFKYYDRAELRGNNWGWDIDGSPLTIYCAVDLATSLGDVFDYTVIVIGAVDPMGNRYPLDIMRYKTDKVSETLENIVVAYNKYQFKQIMIEAVAGFKLVAQDLIERLHQRGVRVPHELYNPPKKEAKAVRINNILEPLYKTGVMYHFRGGNCEILEHELVNINPAHDDTKDAWAMCNLMMKPPIVRKHRKHNNNLVYHPRFGGVMAG